MYEFQYIKAADVGQAVASKASAGAKFVAGGTTLIDLMKLEVERPKLLVDINGLPLDRIERDAAGGLKIGAMVRNSDLAHDEQVQRYIRCCLRRCFRARRRSCGIWLPRAATCCNARAATTSAT